MGLFPKDLRWSIIGSVFVLAAALLAIAWFDITHGGEAEPAPLLGTEGTPVRKAYIPSTPTPEGLQATPRSRPTIVGAAPGTPAERDAKRRTDLATLLEAARQQKARDGSFLTTTGNVQTICAFQIDQGCKLKEFLPGQVLLADPLGSPINNGYWYSSDGQTAKFYAALEEDVPEDEICETRDVELQKKSNLICVETS